jgi:hypothetical protein
LGLYSLLFPSPVRQRKTNRQQNNSKTTLPLRTITLLLLLLTTTSFWSQENLVLNPSFEDTASMTYGYPFVVTSNWWSANGSDADYFSPFESLLPLGSGQVLGVPFSYAGYQVAQDGQAYCGLVIYESTGDTKEYLQGFLSEPLISGQSYCVSIWVSLADSSGLRSCDFQVAFTNENMNDGSVGGSLGLQNSVSFDIADIDTSSWTQYQAVYIAAGGEQFIYLGSNTPSKQLTCAEEYNSTWAWNTAYILIDHVSVELSTTCEMPVRELEEAKWFIYPNPVEKFIHVSGLASNNSCWIMLNTAGDVILTGDLKEDHSFIDVSQFASGIYLLRFNNGQSVRVILEAD